MNQRRLPSTLAVFALLASAACSTKAQDPPPGFDYAPLERVLSTYVDGAARVDYAALKKNRRDLDRFIKQISSVSPASHPQLFPTRQARLAYWINAYNAWILRLVVDHYPTSSITKIGLLPYAAFYTLRVEVGGRKMTLHGLETHELREGFQEARIHFAINCASRSCPPLSKTVYRPETLDPQLDAAARAFINDGRQITLDAAGHRLVLSKIFDWYAADFKEGYRQRTGRQGTVGDFLGLYLTPERRARLEKLSKITYHDYDWSLNDVTAK